MPTRILNNKLLYIITLLLCAVAMFSCTDEQEGSFRSAKEKMVTFSVRVPGSSAPKSYALNGADENEVKSIEILLFTTSQTPTYTGLAVYSNKITTDPNDNSIKTFSVKVPEGNYNMVVLANARQSVATALASVNANDAKAVVLDKILLNNGGKWNTTPGSAGYIPIPMWGEIETISVGANTPTSNPVNLSRMLAKIDVSLSNTLVAQNKFKLKSIRLYNYNNSGKVVPDALKWDKTQKRVTAPSIPSSAQKPNNPSQNSLTYTSIVNDSECLGEIYTFEADKGSNSNLPTNSCLVIGGVYGTDTQETFYRVDFANTVGSTTTYLDLLRNHRYNVSIADVQASGFSNALDAFNSRPINIQASVVEWVDGKFTQFVVDGQYLLGFSKGKLEFSREARTTQSTDNTFSIVTDYPGGWRISKITGNSPSWLTFSKNWGNVNAPTGEDLKITMSENTWGSPRTANVYFEAGRLTYVLEIKQDTKSNMGIRVLDSNGLESNYLEFVADADMVPAAQTFEVHWSPASSDLIFKSTAMSLNRPFTFLNTAGLDVIPSNGSVTDPTGITTYTIQPPAITTTDLNADPFYERSSVVLYTVADKSGQMRAMPLTLRQYVYNTTAEAEPMHTLNGSTYKLIVKSNTGWRIKSIQQYTESGSGSMLNLQPTDGLETNALGGYNTDTGTELTFTTSKPSSGLSGYVRVTIESPDTPKKFADVTVDLNFVNEYYPDYHKGWAGSNIYHDGAKLTFRDVDDTSVELWQGVYFKWGSLFGLSPKAQAWPNGFYIYPPSGDYYYASHGNYGFKDYETDIPRHPDVRITSYFAPPGKDHYNRAYLYEVTDAATGIGDICKHLTDMGWAPGSPKKKWRMPTYREMYTNGWDGLGKDVGGNNPATSFYNEFGRTNMTRYHEVLTTKGQTVRFPSTNWYRVGQAYHGAAGTAAGTVGGVYWTQASNPSIASQALAFRFDTTTGNTGANWVREIAMPVRCVVDSE